MPIPRGLPVLLLLGLLPAAPASAADPSREDFVPGEVIVRFEPGADAEDRTAAREDAGVELVRPLRMARTQLVEVEPGQTVSEAVSELEGRADVAFAEPNWILRAHATPNDPYFSNLYGLQNTGQAFLGFSGGTADADIDAPEAWDTSTGSADVTVAVVDTGVAYDHPDLAANMWINAGDPVGGGDQDGNGFTDDVRGWDFVDNDNDPRDFDGHGTHVAGTLAAVGDNGLGVTGVAWSARIMAIRVLDADGYGSTADIAEGFDYAGDHGARIVNASLGGPGTSGGAMRTAINAHPDTLFVVAAGNETNDNDGAVKDFPCNITSANLICVAATTRTDALASYSNFGATSVDLGAPGSSIQSTYPRGAVTHVDGFQAGLTKWIQGGTGGQFMATDDPSLPYAEATGPAHPGGYDADDDFMLDDEPEVEEYRSGENFWIQSATPLGSASAKACVLRFGIRYDLPIGDQFVVETSTTGTGQWKLRRVYEGDELDWEDGAVWLGPTEPAYVRFRLDANNSADTASNFDGVQIDEVDYRCFTGTYTTADYAIFSGTSMASPHVAGAAAVLAAAQPAASVNNLRTWLLTSGDPLATLGGGKTVTGRRLNLNNAVDMAMGSEIDPSVATEEATSISDTGATLNGTVAPNGTATTYRFEWGEDTAYGNAIPVAATNVGSGSAPVSVSQVLSSLTPETTYHFRLVAYRNEVPVAVGPDRSFATAAAEVVTSAAADDSPESLPATDGTAVQPAAPDAESGTETPAAAGAAPTAGLASLQPVGAVLLRFTCASRCTARGKLLAPRSLRRVLGGTRLLADGEGTFPTGSQRARLTIPKAKLRRLRSTGASTVKARLTLRVTDASGRVLTLSRTVRVKITRS